MKLFFMGRRSSGVEQLIRNQQVAGSNPIAGSKLKQQLSPFWEVAVFCSRKNGGRLPLIICQ
jgi:hypothetical protein